MDDIRNGWDLEIEHTEDGRIKVVYEKGELSGHFKCKDESYINDILRKILDDKRVRNQRMARYVKQAINSLVFGYITEA